MTPALTFATPVLLVGLLAAAIPPLLHLLSRARAKEVAFPTLRFLALSMERTARRRRLRSRRQAARRTSRGSNIEMNAAAVRYSQPPP